MRSPPTVICHADWGVEAKKRWSAAAVLDATTGRYRARAPQLVAPSSSIVERLGGPGGIKGPAVVGFDFPIGLPAGYAHLAGITSFPAALRQFGVGDWAMFYEIADSAEEISIMRPFYPRTSGTKGQHRFAILEAALGLARADLMRRCERASAGARAASPMFWTIGGAQVGKGALSGWREFLAPALADPAANAALWPFDGRLSELIGSRTLTIVETYPAAYYTWAGVKFGDKDPKGKSGKTRQHDRRRQADALTAKANELQIELAPELEAAIRDGFGNRSSGEDQFDAVIGLFALVAAVSDALPEGVPWDEPSVTQVEGWILGRQTQ